MTGLQAALSEAQHQTQRYRVVVANRGGRRRIGAEQTYFTHIAHDLGHAETCAALPAGMALAYDGLTLMVS